MSTTNSSHEMYHSKEDNYDYYNPNDNHEFDELDIFNESIH